ncbi:MAG: hypothetical protein Q4G58_10795 [bacterium]|nr:hypothetical protein [bacterium]
MANCNQCPRGCDESNLKCQRGRDYFKNGGKPSMEIESKNKLVGKLIQCGKIAQHKSQKMLEHDIDESKMLEALNEQQQEELFNLLNTLQTTWFEEHQKRMNAMLSKEPSRRVCE